MDAFADSLTHLVPARFAPYPANQPGQLKRASGPPEQTPVGQSDHPVGSSDHSVGFSRPVHATSFSWSVDAPQYLIEPASAGLPPQFIHLRPSV